MKILYAFLVAATMIACSEQKFSSTTPGKNPTSGKPPRTGSNVTVENSPTTPTADEPLVTDSGTGSLVPDYTQCAALPSAGYAGGGACEANQVMVIINDGKAGGRSCCPVGKNILSVVPAEVNQIRAGVCLADEVATGISAMTSPFCTKITASLKLQPAGRATYGKANSAGKLGPIAATYNKGDCCACPEGSVMIGGHSNGDNSCSDQCVTILKK